jgi:16S rRNA C967 or C1407 C5-methylase (RsmB/RsmF family)
MDYTLIPKLFFDNLESHFGKLVSEKVKLGLTLPPTVSVRINPEKPTHKFDQERKVPWAPWSFLLKERHSFSLDPLFHAGAYYVQDSSSMVLDFILSKLEFSSEGILALDACAAPGGKSLILSDFLKNKGFLIANEIDGKRNAILSENLLKWGSAHHAVTQLSSQKWREIGGVFDLVLVDAPCSGEGMFRKDDFAVTQWSNSLINQCAESQRQILDNLSETIIEGGYLIYSTCTMNPFENENQLEHLLENGFESATPDLSQFSEFLIPIHLENKLVGYYLLPGISTGEGLFISVLRKTSDSKNRVGFKSFNLTAANGQVIETFVQSEFMGSWMKEGDNYAVNDSFDLLDRFPDRMAFKSVGIPAYTLKGKDIIPLHGLAMLPSAKAHFELDLSEALNYLRKERISAPSNSDQKWMLVGFENHVLGWVKYVPGRLNNYYPTHFRLRM